MINNGSLKLCIYLPMLAGTPKGCLTQMENLSNSSSEKSASAKMRHATGNGAQKNDGKRTSLSVKYLIGSLTL
jgi:hypothetical protein